jgi:hypothetical protein
MLVTGCVSNTSIDGGQGVWRGVKSDRDARLLSATY